MHQFTCYDCAPHKYKFFFYGFTVTKALCEHCRRERECIYD